MRGVAVSIWRVSKWWLGLSLLMACNKHRGSLEKSRAELKPGRSNGNRHSSFCLATTAIMHSNIQWPTTQLNSAIVACTMREVQKYFAKLVRPCHAMA